MHFYVITSYRLGAAFLGWGWQSQLQLLCGKGCGFVVVWGSYLFCGFVSFREVRFLCRGFVSVSVS